MLVQNVSLSPGSRVRGSPHDGHDVGNFHFGLRRFGTRPRFTGPTTSGMTSPAFRTMTRSPGRTSFAATWSSLCSVATPTVEPPTKTGSSWAKGVARPVRPMETWIATSRVVRSSGGNLNAMAHRGALDVAPRTRVQGQVVDLGDHAVDLVGQRVALLLELAAPHERPRGCP